KLDGNWSEWSAGAAAAVTDFYTKLEGSDAKAQRAGLDALKRKLDVMQRAINDPKYASLHDPLIALHNRLSRHVEFAEATLDTLEMDPMTARTANLKKSSQAVTSAVGALESYLSGVSGGKPWLSYVKGDVLRTALAKGADSDAAVTAAKQGKEKIAGRASLTVEDQKQFLGRPPFLAYETAVDQYLETIAWQPPANAVEELRAQLKTLFDSADSYAESRLKEDATKTRVAFAEIRKVAPDAGERLSTVLQKYLFNYNTRIVATEEFLNRLMSDARTEQGPVVDNVLGAAVSGQQTTKTIVGVDLRPSPNTAKFDLALKGTIQSNTVGVTSQATVQTSGYHTFLAAKPVTFDGQKFTTAPATISVNPHNTTTGVSTNMGGILFGGIARNIASQEVEKRRGQAEAIAASRVRERVLPRFNSEADKSFADATVKIEKELFAGLRSTGLYPDAITYQSTDTVLRVNSRLMASGELGADAPHAGLASDRGATAMLHESAINNSIDRLELAGQTLTDEELRAKFEAFLSKALNREVKFKTPVKAPAEEGEDEKKLSAIIFAPTDPMRVRIENGELVLVIRAGFKQEGKEDIPMREIVAPIAFEVKGKEILATRGNVKVTAAGGEGGGIATNGVIRKKIQSVLPDRTLDGKVEIKGPSKTVVAQVIRIKVADGWIAITVN
ncbi:MAG: hypothetical protein H7062_21165, partial [Candidatus Saccharimonas sp.]|nr:hypothetical protein [Planctomycetaceae bacterium]